MSSELPEDLREKILLMPEYRQGTNKVRVKLKDGTVYSSVFVAWGREIVKVGNETAVPFDAADIVDIENDL